MADFVSIGVTLFVFSKFDVLSNFVPNILHSSQYLRMFNVGSRRLPPNSNFETSECERSSARNRITVF